MLNGITCSVQALVTAASNSTTTGVSGSAVVDMSKYHSAVARAHIGKLPDNKGALSAATLTIYETTNSVLKGSAITASIVTNAAISNSAECMLQTEVTADQLSDGYRYIYAHFNANTLSEVSVIIERGKGRFDPQD